MYAKIGLLLIPVSRSRVSAFENDNLCTFRTLHISQLQCVRLHDITQVDRVPNQNPDSAHRQRTHEDKVAKVPFGQSHILEREDLYQPLQDVPDISTPPLDSPLNFYDNEPRNCAVRDRHFHDAGLVLRY